MTNKIEIGTKIYYTGDMANPSGNFVVTGKIHNAYVLKELDKTREFKGVHESQIGHEYHGHCDPRFVTQEARKSYREAQINRNNPPSPLLGSFDGK